MAKQLDRREQTKINYMQNGGNMKKAMIDAGYSENYADRNSKYLMGIIGDDIKAQQDEIKQEGIKSIADIQQWWSDVVGDDQQEMKDRMKASELLVKSQGGFIDKVDVKGTVNNPLAGFSTEELKRLVLDD